MTDLLSPEKSTTVRILPGAVTIREFDSTDLPGIRAMSHHLSARSLYQRFFAGTPAIPAALLRQLAQVDHDRQDAVVAVADHLVVGLAQAVRTEPGTAEIGVLVVDAWQNRGLGRTLVTALAERALPRGIGEFRASVLPGNEPARHALTRLWPGAVDSVDEDCLLYRLPLAPLLSASPTAPARAPGGLRRCVAAR
ncbi:N-acetyltransferase family protein [Saccharomonospora xinjiangensis]|uniref:GNAT family N-acetyltransferase n=1 Tax=Saccharomonospora xinjiangensis TaxID=75294 RepID=UPI00350FDF39